MGLTLLNGTSANTGNSNNAYNVQTNGDWNNNNVNNTNGLAVGF